MPQLITAHKEGTVEQNGIAPYVFDESQVEFKYQEDKYNGISVMFLRNGTILTREKHPRGGSSNFLRSYEFGGEALKMILYSQHYDYEKIISISELEKWDTDGLGYRFAMVITNRQKLENGNFPFDQSMDVGTSSLYARISSELAAIKYAIRLAPEEVRKQFAACPEIQ